MVAIGDDGRAEAIKLVRELRRAGLAAQMEYDARGVKAQMKRADRVQARVTLIVGGDELAQWRPVGDVPADELADDGVHGTSRRVHRVVGARIERLARREDGAQIGHGLGVVGHRTPVTLAHDALPVVFR